MQRPRYAVFTSIGDQLNPALFDWKSPSSPPIDLICTFYGENAGILSSLEAYCDYLVERKGSKYQNLLFFHREVFPLDQYDYIWVADDDIIISADDLSTLFSIVHYNQFSVSQPAFSPSSRLSHYLTLQKHPQGFRKVNFVEVTCPLFRSDSLSRFIHIISPFEHILSAWGLDYLWTQLLFSPDDPFAIVDEITVVNPQPSTRPNQVRECSAFDKRPLNRTEQWRYMANTLGISLTIDYLELYHSPSSYPLW